MDVVVVPLAAANSESVENQPGTESPGPESGGESAPESGSGNAIDACVSSQVEKAVIGAGTSFYWAMRMLPLQKRRAIFAVYAFCRAVDDIADSADAAAGKVAALAEWRAEIDGLYGDAGDSGASAPASPLASAIADFDLERAAFIAIIDGMEMDAKGPIIAPTMAELETYCSRVASAVGLLCIRIFGDDSEDGRAVAASLGLALQLTNILRDIREDAQMGRLYLPRELLEAHDIGSRDPLEVLHHANLPAVCRALAERAGQEFSLAQAAINRCSSRSLRPAIVMMKVYHRTLRQLRRRDWRDVATYAPSRLARALDKAGKLLVALRYGLV